MMAARRALGRYLAGRRTGRRPGTRPPTLSRTSSPRNEARAAAPLPGAGGRRLDLRPRRDPRAGLVGRAEVAAAPHAAGAAAAVAAPRRPASRPAPAAAPSPRPRRMPPAQRLVRAVLSDADQPPPALAPPLLVPHAGGRRSAPLPRSPAAGRADRLPRRRRAAAAAPGRRRRPAAGRSRPGCWSGASRAAPALAPGGTLGGSQAGARLLYRLGGGAGAERRALYLPLRRDRGRRGGGRASTGGRSRALPLHLLAERRQALGARGPLGLRAHALWRRRAGRCRAACGSTPTARRASSARARATCSSTARSASRAPVGPVEVGGGAWGAAQPGAARLDAGPQPLLPAAGCAARTSGSRPTGASASPATPRPARGRRSPSPPTFESAARLPRARIPR